MPKGKHLTLDNRQQIQLGLNEGRSFKDIAVNLGKDPSTISKEVRNHITLAELTLARTEVTFAELELSFAIQ